MRYIKSFANDSAIQEAVDNKTLGKPYVALNDQTGKIDWNGKDIDYSKMYLTIEALQSGTITARIDSMYITGNLYYSVNGEEWVTANTGYNFISLQEGDTVRFKGNLTSAKELITGITIKCNVYGNILSLNYGDEFYGGTSGISYHQTFKNSNIIDASNLILPVENMKFNNMFYYCQLMQKAPVLRAQTLTNYCYEYMFSDCLSLNYIECPATDISAQYCLTNWVRNVSPTGTFVKKAGVSWPTGVSGIPEGWTVIEE